MSLIEDRKTRISNYIRTCTAPSGKLAVSSLAIICKNLIKAQRDRDKANEACGNDYKNARAMTRVREARCAEELSFWEDLLATVISDMEHNGFENE